MEVRNRYYFVRHAESTANVQGFIASRPSYSCLSFGLTQRGITQAKEAAEEFADSMQTANNPESKGVCIYFSDLARAKQTAYCFHNTLQMQGMITVECMVETSLLRERDFGRLELTPKENYHRVWQADQLDGPLSTAYGSESSESVARRVAQLVDLCESTHNGCDILLVCHGDVCQIGYTVFTPHLSANQHRFLPHMGNAEVRRVCTKLTSKL